MQKVCFTATSMSLGSFHRHSISLTLVLQGPTCFMSAFLCLGLSRTLPADAAGTSSSASSSPLRGALPVQRLPPAGGGAHLMGSERSLHDRQVSTFHREAGVQPLDMPYDLP